MVVGWKPTADRKKKLTTLTHDLSQFMLYKLYEHACPADALELTQNFEFAYCKWEGAVWGRKIPEDGPQPIGYSR